MSTEDSNDAIEQCPACFWHPDHEPDEWFREEKELRSAALKAAQAEIAALTERVRQLDNENQKFMREIAALTEQRDIVTERLEELVAWAEQRDRAIAERNETRDRTYETIRQLRERRDRAMVIVEAAQAWAVDRHAAMTSAFFPTETRLFNAVVGFNSLDTESSPSLPETL